MMKLQCWKTDQWLPGLRPYLQTILKKSNIAKIPRIHKKTIICNKQIHATCMV